MSWLSQTFAVLYDQSSNQHDEPGEKSASIFFYPPVPENQINCIVGACGGANQLVHEFGGGDNVEFLEVGEARLAFHHEGPVTFVIGSEASYPESALKLLRDDFIAVFHMFNKSIPFLIEKAGSLPEFEHLLAEICAQQLVPALTLLRSRSAAGFHVLPSVQVPPHATRYFSLGWQIVSALGLVERRGPLAACVVVDGRVLCADMRPATARHLLPSVEELQKQLRLDTSRPGELMQSSLPVYATAAELNPSRDLTRSQDTSAGAVAGAAAAAATDDDTELLEARLHLFAVPNVTVVILAAASAMISDRALLAAVRDLQSSLERLSAVSAELVPPTAAPAAGSRASTLVFEEGKMRLQGAAHDAGFARQCAAGHDYFAQRPELTQAVFCQAAGDALYCRRMFDKEVFVRLSAPSARRVADVERQAQDALAKEQIYFL